MVGKAGREWLEGLDPETKATLAKKAAEHRVYLKELYLQALKNEAYNRAINNEVSSLNTQGLPQTYTQRTGSGTVDVSEVKQVVTQLVEEAEEFKTIITNLHEKADNMATVSADVADQSDSNRMRDAMNYMNSVMTACNEAQDKLSGAITEYNDYLTALNQL